MPKIISESEVLTSHDPASAALIFIEKFGGFDGAHHKDWVLDQVARILHGTPVHVTLRKWDDGQEALDYRTGEPSESYLEWAKSMLGEYDPEFEEYEYDYSEGIAP